MNAIDVFGESASYRHLTEEQLQKIFTAATDALVVMLEKEEGTRLEVAREYLMGYPVGVWLGFIEQGQVGYDADYNLKNAIKVLGFNPRDGQIE